MAILNQKRILNLIPKISAPVTLHVSQGDVGTEIQFTLVKGDELFVNPGNVSASVHGVREDGANFGAFTCTLSGSTVSFPLHSEMTAVKGSALAEIVIVDNHGNKVGSANFAILVEESVFPLGVTYDNDVSVYESILAYVQTIPAQLQGALTAEINARQIADNTEINARQSAISNLQAQIDEIIAPSGEAPSAAEVQNARIGENGITYPTLGDSIRGQIGEHNVIFEDITSPTQNLLDPLKRVFGKRLNDNGEVVTDAVESYFNQYIPVIENQNLIVTWVQVTMHARKLYTFDANKALIARVDFNNSGKQYHVPSNVKYVSFQAYSSDTDIQLEITDRVTEYEDYYSAKDKIVRNLLDNVFADSKNMFDKNSLFHRHIKNDNNEVIDDSGSYYTHYISVVPSHSYYINAKIYRIYEYDANKNLIQRLLAPRPQEEYGVYECPNNVFFIQIQISSDYLDYMEYAQIEEGTEDTPYTPFNKKSCIDIDARGILSDVSEAYRKNLFNKNSLVSGFIRNSSGTITTDSTSSYYSQYISVIPEEKYYINFGVQRIYFFDENKNFLRRTNTFANPDGIKHGVFVCPSDVYFIQIQIRDGHSYNIENAQIEKGTTETEYVDYNVYSAVDYESRGKLTDTYYNSRLFPNLEYWEPTTADSQYSNPTSGNGRDTRRADWAAEDKYLYYEFLEHYYDVYLGTQLDGYRVTKKSLGQDSAHLGHELFEYDFCPIDYKYTVLLSAGMNADETQGIWGLATFIRGIMNNEEECLKIMHDNVRFKVIPIINASGFDEDLLRYNYSDDVNPNFNFNYKDSWSRQSATWAYKGEYPDSNISTVYLKKWINDNAWKANLWIDIHTGRWNNEYPNKKIYDVRVADSSMVTIFNQSGIGTKIKDYYIDKGYVSSSDNVGGVASIRDNLDYQKGVYAFDVCGIKAIMPEMHLESTGYGADGFTNNTENGIKCYVGQIRIMIMAFLNSELSGTPKKLDSANFIALHSRY